MTGARRVVGAAALALICLPLTAFGDVTLSIEGNAAARFSLDCNGVTHDGAPPYERRFPAPLTCTITQTATNGTLRATALSERGNRSNFTVSGSGSMIRMQVE